MAVYDYWPRTWSNATYYTYSSSTANNTFVAPVAAPTPKQQRQQTELEMLDERIDGVCATGRKALS